MTKSLPPRPTMAHPIVRREVILSVLGSVVEWVKAHHSMLADADDEQLVSELMSAFDVDAFVLARNLEKNGWPCNAALVKLLDEEMDAQKILRFNVERWVRELDIKTGFRVGDQVALPWCARCVVVWIDTSTAMIIVAPSDRRDLWRGPFQADRAGWHVPFEDVVPIVGTIGEPTEDKRVATCEACDKAIMLGDAYHSGESADLCAECAPEYSDLLSVTESFINAEGEPMTSDEARAAYDAHIAAGGKPDDKFGLRVAEVS